MTTSMQSLAFMSMIALNLPLQAYAHMEMRWPYAFRSKFDTAISDPEYENFRPLNSDGSNYPCRGFQNLTSSQISKVTYIPGMTYNITLAGEESHLGGSCQLSLSYDNGRSFKVVKSMIGGCSLKKDWDFTVPSDAPTSDNAILAWTWFNIIGNREMYMNCARVSIVGQPVQRYRKRQMKRQASYSTLPDLFVCNIGNGCKTVEGREVVFPNPGPDIEMNDDEIIPSDGPGFILDSVTIGTPTTSVSRTSVVSAGPGSGSGSGSGSASAIEYSHSMYLLTESSTSVFSTFSSAPPSSTNLIARKADPAVLLVTTTDSISILTSTSTLTTIISTSTSSLSSSSSTSVTTLTSTLVATSTSTSISTSTSSTTTLAFATTSTSFLTSTIPTTTSPTTATTTQSSTSSTSTPTSISTSTSASLAPSTTTTTTPTITTLITSTTSTSPTATIIPTACTPGSFTCNSSTTFSQCVPDGSGSGTYVFMGSVAAGTQCVGGSIIRQNAGVCTPNGSLQCNGQTAFYLCDQGGLINMGSVAPGTACRDGIIGFA